MARDLISALGNEELNALMAVQLGKLSDGVNQLNQLFQENNCTDFNSAFQNGGINDAFITRRNDLLSAVTSILDVMHGLRAAQDALAKSRRRESNEP